MSTPSCAKVEIFVKIFEEFCDKLDKPVKKCYTIKALGESPINFIAGMMELADVPDSKSGGSDTVWVQVPLPAPNNNRHCFVKQWRLLKFD